MSEGGRRQRLAYRRYDKSPEASWVVLLPGAGAASAIWRRQIPFLRQRHNVLVIDLPGHGRSPLGRRGELYHFEAIARQIIGVLDEERILRPHLVSMSLGALLAEEVAALYPDRVRTLVLAGGIAGLSWWALLLMHAGRAVSPVVPYIGLYRLFAWIMMPGRTHAETRRLFTVHAARLGRGEFLRWYELSSQVGAVMQQNESRRALVPTLFVMGEEDYMFLEFARARARKRFDTSLSVISRSGHVCSVENPQDFNRIVGAFLEEQDKHKGTCG